uniref:Secreted protein n=1 Tax=Oryzias sinensis TaxID=183150 RepID=A0A8C8DQ81_9TELE
MCLLDVCCVFIGKHLFCFVFMVVQSQRCKNSTCITQRKESRNRLYHAATLPSTRWGAISYGSQASANSLHLKSTYDHKDLFWSKNQIVCQETISEHRYVLDEKDIRIWVDPKRSSIHKGS